MGAVNDRSAEGPRSERPERRSRRSDCLADALRFQLDACREAEGLDAIVVSDELGFCVSHSGGEGSHAELAAQLPIFAHPVRPFEDADDREVLHTPCGPMVVTTFTIGDATLHACAVGAPSAEGRPSAASGLAVLKRVASGFSRLLA